MMISKFGLEGELYSLVLTHILYHKQCLRKTYSKNLNHFLFLLKKKKTAINIKHVNSSGTNEYCFMRAQENTLISQSAEYGNGKYTKS